ncbi:protein SRC2-like [Bidens hawaiensis]|uniref:protein SRC2-like n=1 Tax=Bidens hawaiensis TaxID=980011 RepID=UPI00404921B8
MEISRTDEPETRILEINLISAQDLNKIRPIRRMHTYVLAWVDPRTRLRSDLDRVGGENPTWNDKFLFRVSEDFINADISAVQIQIYAVGYIRDNFVGTVRYILSSSSPRSDGIPCFSALHIRRRSGRVQGVLNIAATVFRGSDFPSLSGISAICVRDLIGKNNKTPRDVGSKRSEHAASKEAAESSCNLYCQEKSSFTTITVFRESVVMAG